MKNLPCEVVRDLMPVAAENMVGEKTRELMDDHLATCPDCSAAFEEMKQKLPLVPEPAPAEQTFMKSFRQMVKTIRRKNVLWGLAGLLTAVVLISVGIYAYNSLLVFEDSPVPLEWYNIRLLQTSEGTVLTEITMQEGRRFHGYSSTWDEDTGIMYIQLKKPVLDILPEDDLPNPYISNGSLSIKDGVLYMGDWVEDEEEEYYRVWHAYMTPIPEIRLGNAEKYTVLYAQGDELPACPKALEKEYRYFMIKDGERSRY